VAERQHNLRVGLRADWHSSRAGQTSFWLPIRVAPFNRQRRAIDRIERHDPLRTPAESQREMTVIAVGFIGEQRMIPLILAFPDQAGKVIAAVKGAIDPQRFGSLRSPLTPSSGAGN
jgi:hypothetical protein